MNIEIVITIPKDLAPFADTAWKASGSGEPSAEAYVASLISTELQENADARVSEVVSSWRPVDAPEVIARKEAVAAKLKDIPVEKLEAIEAALAVESVVGPVEEEIKP